MNTVESTLHIGVDEAGRGPVLGDLVVGLVVLNNQQYVYLKNLGIRDSKELTPIQREYFVNSIYENSIIVHTTYLPPLVIDLNRLNRLLAKTFVSSINIALTILRKFFDENTIVKIYTDEVTGYSDSIKAMINRKIFGNIDIVVEPKADKKYTVVSAASIVAKYYRDRNLYLSKKIYGNFGSGYPSDQRTRLWIVENYSIYRDPPVIIRRSWSTLSVLAPKWYSSVKHGKSILNYLER
ncbi:MAG: ribonuclease HII [Desulfurococcaceae archaeon]